MTSRLEVATYLMALGRLRGVGIRTVASIATQFPDAERLLAASPDELKAALGVRAAAVLDDGLARDWAVARSGAERTVEEHLGRAISVIPITDIAYPPLLRLINDPPPVLFVRGDERALATPKAVAVVGTREATQLGLSVARRVAQRFAEAGYVVVSGLAKGIDTAAHEGALLGGTTIAVLGTPLDKIYPAENKRLASQIEAAGALVTEYPLGTVSRGQSFVERDRLQAGMSLAIVPVQTGLQGGTQHTIRFAEAQGRLLLCPRPLDVETRASAYDGIHALIESGRARSFDSESYAEIWALLGAHETRLLGETMTAREVVGARSPRSRGHGHGRKATKGSNPTEDDLGLFGEPSPEPVSVDRNDLSRWSQQAETPPRPIDLSDLLVELERVLDAMAPNLDGEGFEVVLRQLRVRHGNIPTKVGQQPKSG